MLHRIALAVALMLAAGTALADLDEYKNWDHSPQGYFMTAAERAEWSRIRTDADAERFVAAFLAKRDANFADEVQNRAAQADKYLTVGKLPGSKTLRGKTVILLGPPSSLSVNDMTMANTKRDNVAASGAMTGGANASAPDGGGSGGSMESPTNMGLSITTMHVVRLYRMIFDSTPAGKLDITIEADSNNGRDRVPSRSDAKALNQAFEKAAQASIVK